MNFTFEGSRVTWYGRLGPENGIADVYLDGVLDRTVDTYDGNDIPNVAVYSRAFPAVGKHTLMIRLHCPSESCKGWVVVDGLQVERGATKVIDHMPGHGIVYRGMGPRASTDEP